MREKANRDSRAYSVSRSFAFHWPLYIFEGVELALFMISACVFTVILFDPSFPVQNKLPDPALRRLLMGAYGLNGNSHHSLLYGQALRSAFQSGHVNLPSSGKDLSDLTPVSTCYAIHWWCRWGRCVSLFLGRPLNDPSVMYAETVPGKYGTGAAFAAEAFMAALLMGVVLWASNRPSLAPWTGYFVGILITFYVLLFAPVSGFSINPARTMASAVFADGWTAIWLYFSAPLLGMLFSAEVYIRSQGSDRILCAKLHPDPAYECPFLCHYPGHHPAAVKNQIS